jgi:hypothetical protein
MATPTFLPIQPGWEDYSLIIPENLYHTILT